MWTYSEMDKTGGFTFQWLLVKQWINSPETASPPRATLIRSQLTSYRLNIYSRGGEPFSSQGPFPFLQHPPRAVQMIELNVCLKQLTSQPIHLAFLSCCAKGKQPLNPDILPWLAYACTCTVVAWPPKQKDIGHKMCANVFSFISMWTWFKCGGDLTSSSHARSPGKICFKCWS